MERGNWKIVFTVLGIHFALIFAMIFEYSPKRVHSKPIKMVIQSVKLTPKQETKIASAPLPQITLPPEPKIVSEPEPIEKPVVKKEKAKEKPKAKPAAKPVPAPAAKPKKAETKKATSTKKSSKPKVDQKLLKNIEESIAKIGKKPDNSSSSAAVSIDVPKVIHSLSVESTNGDDATGQEAEYEDELALYLKSLLILPEYGDVRLTLKLKRSGKVISVKVLSSESKKNKRYVEDTLPSLRLPGFGKHFSNEEEHNFTLTLRNAV